MQIQSGEFWVADIVFTDQSASKKRPVLILWLDGADAVAAVVTSATPCSRDRRAPDRLAGRWIRVPSTVRLSRLDCLEQSLFLHRLGAFRQPTLSESSLFGNHTSSRNSNFAPKRRSSSKAKESRKAGNALLGFLVSEMFLMLTLLPPVKMPRLNPEPYLKKCSSPGNSPPRTSSRYRVTAPVIVAFKSAYAFTNRGT